jgi:hypothetical protein
MTFAPLIKHPHQIMCAPLPFSRLECLARTCLSSPSRHTPRLTPSSPTPSLVLGEVSLYVCFLSTTLLQSGLTLPYMFFIWGSSPHQAACAHVVEHVHRQLTRLNLQGVLPPPIFPEPHSACKRRERRERSRRCINIRHPSAGRRDRDSPPSGQFSARH